MSITIASRLALDARRNHLVCAQRLVLALELSKDKPLTRALQDFNWRIPWYVYVGPSPMPICLHRIAGSGGSIFEPNRSVCTLDAFVWLPTPSVWFTLHLAPPAPRYVSAPSSWPAISLLFYIHAQSVRRATPSLHFFNIY